MTHFISITKVGDETELTGNLRIKEYLLTKTDILDYSPIGLIKMVPFWVVEIEKAFQLELISLNRNRFGDIITIDMVFDNPKGE